jgi:hypothetical protein
MRQGFRVYDSDTHVNQAAEILERSAEGHIQESPPVQKLI